MSNQARFSDIIEQIESSNLSQYSEETLEEWRKVLENRLLETEQIGDLEGFAISNIHLIILNLKSKKNTEETEEKYQKSLNALLEAEKKHKTNLEKHRNTPQNKLTISQFDFFYKITEFYLSLLEKTCTNFSLTDLSERIRDQKIEFLKKHLLLQGNIPRYLDYSRLSFQLMIQKHLLLFAILSGVGIVLLWHGLWGTFDWIIGLFGLTDSLFPYIITSVFGALILYILGVFVELTSGTPKEIKEELENATELESIEKIIDGKD